MNLTLIFIICFVIAIITFVWHNTYCTDYGKYLIKKLKFLKNLKKKENKEIKNLNEIKRE